MKQSTTITFILSHIVFAYVFPSWVFWTAVIYYCGVVALKRAEKFDPLCRASKTGYPTAFYVGAPIFSFVIWAVLICENWGRVASYLKSVLETARGKYN